MNSDIAALWAKAFVHIAKLSEIAHTDRMNAQVEAKLARIRLGHLITHVSESQASADEDEFRRLDWIQTLSARMSGLLETIERNVNWFENCKASIPQGVTLYGSALDRERRTAAIEALERVLMSIEEMAECCKVDKNAIPFERGQKPETKSEQNNAPKLPRSRSEKPGEEWFEYWHHTLKADERRLWIAWVEAEAPKPSQFKDEGAKLGFTAKRTEDVIRKIWHKIHQATYVIGCSEDAKLLRKTKAWTVFAMNSDETKHMGANRIPSKINA